MTATVDAPRTGTPPPAGRLRRINWVPVIFALAGVASALRMDGDRVAEARIVFTGVAPVPWRSPETEAVLAGQTLTPDVIARACAAAVEGASPRRHNGYKVDLLKGVLEQELTALA